MVGRKSKSIQTPVSNLLPTEWFTIEHQPDVSWIKDKTVKKNTMMIRQRHGIHHSSVIKEVIQFYKNQKLRYVKAIPLTNDLPLFCPSCKQKGNPEITEDTRTELKTKKFNLIYNHQSGKSSCYIGRVDKSNQYLYVYKLKKGLPLNALLYSGRIGTYSI